MREIKFRYYIKRKNDIILFDFKLTDIELIQEKPEAEVIAKCEYTGLKDKNGKEICEGDIVKSVSPLVRLSDGVKTGGKEANYYEIIWHEGKWTTRDIQNNQINGFAPYPVIWKRYYEVIGNIYENTELLNVKAEGKL